MDELTSVDDLLAEVLGPQACGALRPRLKEPGWACDGTGLVQVLPATLTMPPVVIKRDLLKYVDDATAHMLAVDPWTESAGGDHMHLTIPNGATKR